MSLETKLIEAIQTIGTDIGKLISSLSELSIGPPLSVIRSDEDINGIFTTITYRRQDNSVYKTSIVSGGISPEYTTRTITYFEDDGITVKSTQVYTLTYDVDGVLIQEILQ